MEGGTLLFPGPVRGHGVGGTGHGCQILAPMASSDWEHPAVPWGGEVLGAGLWAVCPSLSVTYPGVLGTPRRVSGVLTLMAILVPRVWFLD